MLPFTHQQFVFVFAVYNGVVWPLQWLAQALGIAMLALLFWPTSQRHRIAVLVLASMWIWTGVAYHLVFFSVINPIAPLFAAVFVVEGLLLAVATWRGRLGVGAARGARAALGWALLV